LPEKFRLILDLADRACLAINFWWFGYAHFAADPADHPMVGKLGPHFMDLSLDDFRALLTGRRGAIKTFLLDQSRVAGIGNVYVQDPLWKARIHPLRPIPTLTDGEIEALYQALRQNFQDSIDQGGFAYEQNLYGQKGSWNCFEVGYREGHPCPRCGTVVQKIKTGSTASYICPGCQKL
jgi:formamidopyrimidine-DNA glycosylase